MSSRPAAFWIAVLSTLCFFQAVAQAATLVGATVILKSPEVKGGELRQGKLMNLRDLQRVDHVVVREMGQWIEVQDEDQSCWLDKADVVAVEQIESYFAKTVTQPLSLPPSHANLDVWVHQQVDALVRYARAAYEEDKTYPAYRSVLHAIADAVRNSNDKSLVSRYPEFVDYVQAASLVMRPNHKLGFTVPDERYLKETSGLVEIPDVLMDQGFLKLVSRPETLGQAKSYLKQLNTKRDEANQLLYLGFESRHLGAPDSLQSFGRLLIVVPGDRQKNVPEKWVQFALTDPGAETLVRNVSVIAAQLASDGTYNAYFRDNYRIYGEDGKISIKGRFELGHGGDACIKCHKSGIAPIFPEANSVIPSERPVLAAVNKRLRSYGVGRFGKYFDSRKLGPGLGSATASQRVAHFGADFAPTPVSRAMSCAKCHNNESRGAINFPMNKVLVNSFISGGRMPLQRRLPVAEREELYDRLIYEYFATDETNPGTLKSWLLGRRREG